MATSGTIKTDVLDKSYFWVQWSQSSQSVENNSTTINWSCGFNPGRQYYTNAIKMNAVTINGVEVYSGGTYSNITDYENRTFASGTLKIAHNSDGSKSFTISGFSGWIYDSGTTYASAQNFTLTTIPRASSVSCSAADIGSNATISISRASSSFTHTLTYAFGSLSGTIATKTSSTSISWALPTTFYAQIPNSKNGTGSITCQTYNGSTLIGSKTCSFVATASEAASKPTLAPTVVDSNTATTALTGNSAKFIKYYSNASVSIGASARNSATLKSQKVTCGGKSISSSSGTINAVESGSFVFSATDSRGYTTSQTVTKTLVNYVKLTCSMVSSAPTTGGVAQISVSGNYWNGNFGAVENTLTVQYRYKVQDGTYSSWTAATATKSGNTYSADISISGLNYLNTYVFQVRAIDKLATVNSDEQIRKTTPVFDWSKEDFNINGTLKVNNKNIFDLIYPVGSVYISFNTTEPSILFGGTWERINNYFLWACDSSGTIGATGGEAKHTLTVAEMPSHGNHLMQGSMYQELTDNESNDGSYRSNTLYLGTSAFTSTGSINRGWKDWNGGEMYPAGTLKGGGKAHNNMPPYIQVAMWKRTA